MSTEVTTTIEQEDKVKFDPLKMTYMWLPLLHMKRKSKKIVRKNRREAGYYSEEFCYDWTKKQAKHLLNVLNVTVKVEGLENWLDTGLVLAPNHQSNIDPVILLAMNDFSVQQPVAFIAKEELWDDKTFGNFVRLIDVIPLDRNNPRSAVAAFKEAKELIVEFKRSMVIFPEGTRSNSQKVGEFLDASMKIAQMANAPVVPVTFINSHLVFAPDRPKHVEVKVVFGKPIPASKHISLATAALTNNVRKEVVANLEKWENKEMHQTIGVSPKKLLKQKEKELEAIKKAKKSNSKKSIKDIFKIVD
ncbi:lysophospholipid acyltransferase family protein [Mesoplasma photuris]|uniref:lysophospholipid acyltransferase family protein n=1 Tax=Mesoplasma photuris TaxID=217731 RepID=UPI0004E1F4FD|nr:lysophospholipid acyltransferase family protein [Mesoplasma photuris]